MIKLTTWNSGRHCWRASIARVKIFFADIFRNSTKDDGLDGRDGLDGLVTYPLHQSMPTRKKILAGSPNVGQGLALAMDKRIQGMTWSIR